MKKTQEKITDIYEEATIKTIDPRIIVQKIHPLVQMKKAEEKLTGVNTATRKPRFQGKQKRKKKNGKVKEKLQDVINELFDVHSEVPETEKSFYEDQKADRKLFLGSVDEEATEFMIEKDEKMKKKKG